MNDIDTRSLEALAATGGLFVRLAIEGKRPIGRQWQTLGTPSVDDVRRWRQYGHNVGLLLGPDSRLVDVETDDETADAVARELGLDSIPGPTWRSARGLHRLYRWRHGLPLSAVAHVGPLEVRIGNRSAQSVLPPSRHPTGTVYRWETSPADIAVPELPASLLDELSSMADRFTLTSEKESAW